jgi:hypothetical protein
VLATDGTEGRNDTGSVDRNSGGAGGGGGKVTDGFFARGMITGRSAGEGSTEFRNGDLTHVDAVGSGAAGVERTCSGDGNDDVDEGDSEGEGDGSEEAGEGNAEGAVVMMAGTGRMTSGNVVLLLEGVGADVDACKGLELLPLGGGESRGLGFSGSIAGVGDCVRMSSDDMSCSGDGDDFGGGGSGDSACCVTGIG